MNTITSIDRSVSILSRKIVVLAPHPDDESLACGGLLSCAFATAGAHIICLTDGSASHSGSTLWPAHRLAEKRRKELLSAIGELGGSADDLTWLGFADSKLDQIDPMTIAAQIAERVFETGGQVIFAPASEDHHEDHKATARVAEALRTLHPEWTYYSYPLWSRWDDLNFHQTIARHDPIFVGTRTVQVRKRAAIDAHQSQLGKIVHDDPTGFVLPPALIEKFIIEDEIYWVMR